jgi:hypothetical protein
MQKPEPPQLAPSEIALIEAQVFTPETPGTLLRDFEALLGFVGEQGVPLTPSHLLAMSQLDRLNRSLSRPVEMRLKRPVQKSYPLINGLYLLLRASGISHIDTRQKSPLLRLDPEVLSAWGGLNPAEQYFELLKAWWGRADEQAIGERGGWTRDYLVRSAWFIDAMLKAGSKSYSSPQEADGLRYHPGLHSLALMEAFGFMELELMRPDSGKGWLPRTIRLTDWGRLLMGGYLAWCRKDPFPEDEGEDAGEEMAVRRFGRWSRSLLPQVREWRHGLELPEPEFRPGPQVFAVMFGKHCWRRIALPGACSLDAFATKILDAFDFDHDHLYRFTYQDRYGREVEIDHPYMAADPLMDFGNALADEVRIGDLPLAEGAHINFLYDFGAHWEFDIVAESLDARIPVEAPQLLESHGEAPQQYDEGEE